MRPRGRRIALLLIASAVVATWGGLAARARSFVVARPGTSAEYWEHLCGVQLPSFQGHHRYSHSGAALSEVDGLLYYYDQLHHEQILYDVSVDVVLRDTEAVGRMLAEGECEADFESCPKKDRDLWSRCMFYRSGTPKREACRLVFETEGPISSSTGLQTIAATVRGDEPEKGNAALRDRLQRGRRVSLTLAFEGVYLSAWWGFVAWNLLSLPWSISWRWQVGLGPWLLFLPYFLGYAPMTLTYGPSGGFIYPGYLMLAALPLSVVPCTAADGFVWHLLPHPLSALSQLPGSPSAFSFMVCIGPVSCLIAGLALVVVLSAARFAGRRVGAS